MMSKPRIKFSLLLQVSVLAGLAQIAAGVSMYLAGVYFSRFSGMVSLAVLLICIIIGVQHYQKRVTHQPSFLEVLIVGVSISLFTGCMYAIYNVISISFFYPHFIDDMARARTSMITAATPPAIANHLRQRLTMPQIALTNFRFLVVSGAVLSFVITLALKGWEQLRRRPSKASAEFGGKLERGR